ncbi:zinc finger CCCH domain-containing protein 58-like [Salvia hispanica]|uniref:zinc finger CCCH domain-containing protein 58-like n=1 Tax=Salvia hispanica TaxID=49212 RepID=UPI002009C881|nr:zinc finger CCCH domain-containing protein 58-like [Salvia hispanica]
MDRYSETQAMEPRSVDPAAEWTRPGGEIGLEEPMWRLGLGDGSESYPERPDEPDCIYYLRTGICGYGNRCRFNHPRDRSAVMGDLRATGGEYPERHGEPVCQYYMRTGMCKFGASCKYHHPKHGAGSSSPLTLNFYGYPLRQGEKECLYYIKTGQCKFGVTCKFHHPQPAGIQMPTPSAGPRPLAGPAIMPTPTLYPTVQSPSVQSSQQYGVLHGNWPVPRPTMLPGSYVPGSYAPVLLTPGGVPVPGWNPYSAQVSPGALQSTQPTIGAGPVYGIPQLPPSTTTYMGAHLSGTSLAGPSSSSQKEHTFPDRPGQPECQYYLRTGDCKFGLTCKYHHPPEWSTQKSFVLLSPMGLPMRPGAPLCSHYAQNGVCKFGPSCKFDHPMRALSYSTSASSLTDMPVAPYPVGSTNATLAPSSSSSLDLRPELLSGFSTDASSNLSSANSSSASIGSTFSRSGAIPEFGIHHSEQGITSSIGGSSSNQEGEAKISS